jgi:hypothetical protein
MEVIDSFCLNACIGVRSYCLLLNWQLTKLTKDMDTIKENLNKKSEQVAQYINDSLGVSL